MNSQLIIGKIKHDKGLDISGYKESTITRRIERRMQFDGAKSLEEYIQMIDRDYHLYWRLISDFFIGVTDFFRDKEIWQIVQEKVLKNFHRALREGGILWLGTAESLSQEAAKLFEPVYKNEKIFRKR